MKNLFLALIALIGLVTVAKGQYETVNFDYERARFGENQPLPAESPIIFSGQAGADIVQVEISIYPAKGKEGRDALATGNWKRPADKTGPTAFNLPMSYQLHASKKYDVEVAYFKVASSKEKQVLRNRLSLMINTYIDNQLKETPERIEFNRRSGKMIQDMNELLLDNLSNYRMPNDAKFAGFSELVKMKMEKLEAVKLTAGTPAEGASLAKQRAEWVAELGALVENEIEIMTEGELLKLSDYRYVEDYETESRPGYFALNAGYGTVYLGGNLEKLNYGDSPYLGLAFPLSTSTIAPRFLRDASVTLGVFTNNFKNKEGSKVSGPLVSRPFYLGLDYKLFQFIRFNIGGAVLEEPKLTAGSLDDSSKRIFLQPFIGFSAKVNLSISLDK